MNPRFNPQAKLASHHEFASFIAGKRVVPINVEISPCHVCQAHCNWCFYAGTHQKLRSDSVVDMGMAHGLLSNMMTLGVKALTWTGGGEPTLHPEFPELVMMGRQFDLQQGLFTNALAPIKYDPRFFEWIRVSNTDKPWNETVLKEIRSTAKVLGMALNYIGDDAAVVEALRVADLIGADYLQVRQALALHGHVTERRPTEIKHPKLFITDYKFADSQNKHGYQDCYGFNFAPFVWHDGDVDVCGYHRKKGPPYTLGSLKTHSFGEIIGSAPRKVPVIPTCQACCKNHECNKLVNAAVGALDVHFV